MQVLHGIVQCALLVAVHATAMTSVATIMEPCVPQTPVPSQHHLQQPCSTELVCCYHPQHRFPLCRPCYQRVGQAGLHRMQRSMQAKMAALGVPCEHTLPDHNPGPGAPLPFHMQYAEYSDVGHGFESEGYGINGPAPQATPPAPAAAPPVRLAPAHMAGSIDLNASDDEAEDVYNARHALVLHQQPPPAPVAGTLVGHQPIAAGVPQPQTPMLCVDTVCVFQDDTDSERID